MWRETDVAIPRAVWSAWIPSEGSRAIIRPLRDDERGALEKRVRELVPALAPYLRPDEDDEVALSLMDMFGGFQGAKVQGADAVGKIHSAMMLLAPFPAWAILLACQRVRAEGYDVVERDGTRRERHWPPADAEIVAEVKKEVRLRADALASARALLSAPVETR